MLEDLDESSLKLILTQPKNALVKQYQRLFEMEGVDLTVAAEALGAFARKARLRFFLLANASQLALCHLGLRLNAVFTGRRPTNSGISIASFGERCAM